MKKKISWRSFRVKNSNIKNKLFFAGLFASGKKEYLDEFITCFESENLMIYCSDDNKMEVEKWYMENLLKHHNLSLTIQNSQYSYSHFSLIKYLYVTPDISDGELQEVRNNMMVDGIELF